MHAQPCQQGRSKTAKAGVAELATLPLSLLRMCGGRFLCYVCYAMSSQTCLAYQMLLR